MAGGQYPPAQGQFYGPSAGPFDRKNELPSGFLRNQEQNSSPFAQGITPGGLPAGRNDLPPGFLESQEINKSQFGQGITPGGLPAGRNDLPHDWHTRTRDCKLTLTKLRMTRRSDLQWTMREARTTLLRYSHPRSGQGRKNMI